LNSLEVLLPLAKRAFAPFPESAASIEGLLTEFESQSVGEAKIFLKEIIEKFRQADPKLLDTLGIRVEPSELTVEFAYQAALEEIVGDGVISEREKAVVKNLRNFLEIPDQAFSNIFNEVKTKRKLQQIPVLDREFSPEEFLFRVLVKTIEDGVITPEEKTILQKICEALQMDKDTFTRLFQRAKEARAAQGSSFKMPAKHDTFFDEITQFFKDEKKFQDFLSLQGNAHLMNKIAEHFERLRETDSKPVSVGACFFDTALAPVPTIGVFIPEKDIHFFRTQMKGNAIDAFFTKDVLEIFQNLDFQFEPNCLVFQNPWLDCEFTVSWFAIGENMKKFQEGLKKSEGRYQIRLLSSPGNVTLKLIKKSGFIDLSGNFKRGLELREAGKTPEAIETFRALNTKFPEMSDVLYYLGLCHKNLAVKGISPDENFKIALDFYRTELENHPESEKAMNSIGVILKQKEQWDEALKWLTRAQSYAPYCIPVLATLTTTNYNHEIVNEKVQSSVPKYILELLGAAYHFCPEHSLVIQLVEQFSAIFKTDLVRNFRYLPIDSAFQ